MRASSAMRLRRWPSFGGRKPSKKNRSVGSADITDGRVVLIDGLRLQVAATRGTDTYLVRALDAESIHVSQLQIHEPTLDDVFLAKTGRHLEGAGEDGEAERVAAAEPPGR